ncbi:phage tail assembly protein [Solimonas flava]|uniref:phage tail assembly protein n=1 Tax=Solimonas flava TaxID=415849 RepID=UPI000417D1C6|nr:phage tail assembly protein [Solimonas flava]
MSNVTVKGTLKHGLKIGDVVHKEFELREATTGDMFDAEAEVTPNQPLGFSGALICRQLVRIGTFEGPFVLGMLRKMKPTDFALLRAAQLEAEKLGEA